MLVSKSLISDALKNVLKIHKIRYKKFCSYTAKKSWKIMFFGTDHFALQSLQNLHKAMQEGEMVSQLSVVVPQTKPHLCLVAKYAAKHNLPLSIWPLPKDVGMGATNSGWDLGVVASFGHLIPKRIINIFPMGMLNVHASLLPRWRGAAPVIHALINGDTETGITIMRIKPFQFDIGDIVMQERVPIKPDVDAVELTSQLALIGAELLVRCVSNLEHNLKASVQQPAEGVTLAPKITIEISNVNWGSLSAYQVFNTWRATRHLFKLQTTFHGQIVKLDGMEPPIAENNFSDTERIGKIKVDRQSGLLFVRCRHNWAAFRHITLHRKSIMSPQDFANGYLKKRPIDQHYFSFDPLAAMEMNKCRENVTSGA